MSLGTARDFHGNRLRADAAYIRGGPEFLLEAQLQNLLSMDYLDLVPQQKVTT